MRHEERGSGVMGLGLARLLEGEGAGTKHCHGLMDGKGFLHLYFFILEVLAGSIGLSSKDHGYISVIDLGESRQGSECLLLLSSCLSVAFLLVLLLGREIVRSSGFRGSQIEQSRAWPSLA